MATATGNGKVDRAEPEKPWHAAYPAPQSTVSAITRGELLSWMQGGKLSGKDFLLVDLRRTDYEGGTIHGSINLPAQTLYPTIPALYTLLSAAGIKVVVWYCGSSRGRGPRAAGWFADHITDMNDATMTSCILEDGIRGWATAGDDYVKRMDAYEASIWK